MYTLRNEGKTRWSTDLIGQDFRFKAVIKYTSTALSLPKLKCKVFMKQRKDGDSLHSKLKCCSFQIGLVFTLKWQKHLKDYALPLGQCRLELLGPLSDLILIKSTVLCSIDQQKWALNRISKSCYWSELVTVFESEVLKSRWDRADGQLQISVWNLLCDVLSRLSCQKSLSVDAILVWRQGVVF